MAAQVCALCAPGCGVDAVTTSDDDGTEARLEPLEAEELPGRVEDLETRVDTLWTAGEALGQ